MKLTVDGMNVFTPRIMKLMIGYSEDYFYKDEPQESWKGYFYSLLLLSVIMVQSLLQAKYFEYVYVVSMQIRSALISRVYRKALKMSSASKSEKSSGEIVNLMSVDVQRLMDLIPYLNMLWSSPFQITLSIYFMYDELGYSIFLGVGVLLLAVPLNVVVGNIMKKYQMSQMKNKDDRVKLMNEILGGIKILKLYAWEDSYINKVIGIRNEEVATLKKAAWMNGIIAFVWTSIPFFVALASFTGYIMLGDNVLTSQKAFVTLSYLNIIRMPMAIFPFILIGIISSKVSVDRINDFLNCNELDENAVTYNSDTKEPITIDNGSFNWEPSGKKILQDINLRIEPGSLTAVIGLVGSGKSSLMSAILGEMEKVGGSVNVNGSVAYVPQHAWMRNATVEKNILFGKEYNEKKYRETVESCALSYDLQVLTGGDQTEIGEKGINLSGGQKQRVSLARAVYSEADIYLLDDPLSAVDSHVGKHIFENVLSSSTGVLKDKTRILVTHGITYLPNTDQIIVLKDGKITEQGSYDELMKDSGNFADFIKEFASEGADNESVDTDDQDKKEKKNEEKMGKDDDSKKEGTKIIEKESLETGSVNFVVYKYYFKNIGFFGTLLILGCQVIYSCLSIGTNVWLKVWASSGLGNATNDQYRDMYLGVYGSFGFFQSITSFILSIGLALTTLNASKLMHHSVLKKVLASPMSFFDTTPLGRIVNRFAKDVDICDNLLPSNIRQWMATASNFIGTIILIMYFIPYFAAVSVVLALVFFVIQRIYVNSSRQLKRLDSNSRSPIYSHFGESISGRSTIKAYNLEGQFILESEKTVDQNQKCYYPSIIANRWLSIRIDVIGNVATFSTALFAAMSPETIGASEVGLTISYALNVTMVLTWLVRMTADIETNIVAVERIREYTMLEGEAESTHEIVPEWPSEGSVVFDDYSMRYRKDMNLVLKSINCEIQSGQSVGIVGRTGAGKSSLTVALFRIVEAAKGRILIDNLDISGMKLHDLRSKLTIIPQEPILFFGSLRSNVDPFDQG